MRQQQVIPFQIAIGPHISASAYSVHASTSGAETTTELELPAALLSLAHRLFQPGERQASEHMPRLGQMLGQALLAPPLRDLLLRSARAAARDGGRLQVQLRIATPELAALPWEWMTLGARSPWSPALRDDYTLVRIGRRGAAPPPARLAGPLRVLAIATQDEALQIEALHAALRPALHSGQIDLRLLPDATPQALEMALSTEAPHVLHCAVPAVLLPEGVPQLMIGRGLPAFDLASIAAASPSLRLITLAGRQGDGGTISAATTLLATTLVGDDLPAAIAFSSALPAPASARFVSTCYGDLAAGMAVDLAVTAGRRALSNHSDGRGWGAPQLRMLPGCQQLFVPQRGWGARRAHTAELAAQPEPASEHVGLVAQRRAGASGRALSSRPAVRRARRQPRQLLHWLMLSAIAMMLIGLLLIGRSSGTTSGATFSGLPTAAASAIKQLAVAPPSAQEPTPMPTPTPAPAANTLAQPLPQGQQPGGYMVAAAGTGETIAQIAEQTGGAAAAIAELNRLDAAAPLRAGRALVVPLAQGAADPHGMIVARGDPSRPMVALTFDIEIDSATLYAILDILRERGIKGTFFVTGRWVQAFPDAARAIVSAGHEIGNHSLTHPYFSRIGLDGAASELEQTEQIIQATTGATGRPYFRFPYGDSTPAVVAIVAQHGYVAYHWSADDAAISSWLDRAAQNKADANGGILLMHGRQSTVDSLPQWLDRIAALGLQPTTLGEVLR